MYTINLPDDVVIPDALLSLVEAGDLGDDAKSAADEWVKSNAEAKPTTRSFWQKQISVNVSACERYNEPDVAEFFTYVRKRIEERW